jgi:hypothetical protein
VTRAPDSDQSTALIADRCTVGVMRLDEGPTVALAETHLVAMGHSAHETPARTDRESWDARHPGVDTAFWDLIVAVLWTVATVKLAGGDGWGLVLRSARDRIDDQALPPPVDTERQPRSSHGR